MCLTYLLACLLTHLTHLTYLFLCFAITTIIITITIIINTKIADAYVDMVCTPWAVYYLQNSHLQNSHLQS